LVNSYQHAYGNVNSTALPVFSTFFPNAQTLLPSDTPIDTIFGEGLLPETALFSSTTPVVAGNAELTALLAEPPTPAFPLSAQTPLFDLGFGTPYLLNNDFRVAYAEDALEFPDGAVPTPVLGVPRATVEPTFGLRQDFWLNDMRTAWAPESPTLLCGGGEDPTVYFTVDTETMAAYWSALPAGLVTVLDVNQSPPSGLFAELQTAFQASEAALLAYYQTAAGGGLTLPQAEEAVTENYHVDVAPFCTAAARSFFSQF
jgi:hypothetical protein